MAVYPMTILGTKTIVFRDTTFSVVDHKGQVWLRYDQVGRALGYGQDSSDDDVSRAMRNLYDRHADEFTDTMTAVVELETRGGGKQQCRIFSLRGCHLLAMFARTKVAKEFRKWILDILETYASPQKEALFENLEDCPHEDEIGYEEYKRPEPLTDEQCLFLHKAYYDYMSKLPLHQQGKKFQRLFWALINYEFGVESYRDIPKERYDELVDFIMALDKEDICNNLPFNQPSPPISTEGIPEDTTQWGIYDGVETTEHHAWEWYCTSSKMGSDPALNTPEDVAYHRAEQRGERNRMIIRNMEKLLVRAKQVYMQAGLTLPVRVDNQWDRYDKLEKSLHAVIVDHLQSALRLMQANEEFEKELRNFTDIRRSNPAPISSWSSI